MNKIPIGQTIAKAYRFAFGQFGTALGVIWLPLAIIVGAAWYLFRDVQWPLVAPPADNNSAAEGTMRVMSVLMGPLPKLELILWVCITVMAAGLTRAALGGGRVYAYFSLGAPFWRLLGANLIFGVIFMVAEIALMLPLFLFSAMGLGMQGWIAPDSRGIAVAGLIALGIVGWCTLLYIYLRLGFLIAPVVIAERHIDLRRGWHLAKGNVLRILVILLATTLPLALALDAAIGAGFYFVFRDLPLYTMPDAQFFTDHAASFTALAVVFNLGVIVEFALIYSAPAFAYRALVPAAETPPTA